MTKLNFDITRLNVQDLLPQRVPFIFVDSVLALDPDQKNCVTQFLIKKDTLLMDQGYLSEGGLVENIAQTCALYLGIYNKYILHKEIQIGFIGAIKKFAIFELPKQGDLLSTNIQITTEFGDMKIVNGTIKCAGRDIAHGEFKIAIGNE
ncbi:MAG TPA: pseudouridylate synthase [Bacteroidales bacterium]|nr:pseudouridylate synthase [Bacteroidales bacterium]HOH22186.1 pseudouridylate synthase [Bacteroidales bacterium]HPZ02611.1 pseudouridylate synthase [Bacteroidales bacterium]HQB74490.1 pseudouridylate synthase [Bacteroidales bacterium]